MDLLSKVTSFFKLGTEDLISQGLRPSAGRVGTSVHLKYSIDFKNPKIDPTKVMQSFQSNPNNFVNNSLIRFDKIKGEESILKMGDEFLVHLTDCNTPVRVSEVSSCYWKVKTIDTTPEAGELFFFIEKIGKIWRFNVEFTEKFAEPRENVVYDKSMISKLSQLELWSYTCHLFFKTSLPQYSTIPSVITEQINSDSDYWQRAGSP